MTRTPYQRIIRASERGTGCKLSAHDVRLLAMDTAISVRADLDDLPPGQEVQDAEDEHRARRIANGWDGEEPKR